MDLEEARRRVRLAVPNLTARESGDSAEGSKRFEIGPPQFPVAELILVGFTKLLDFKPFGPGEKMRWGIEAKLDGHPFTVTLEKFGLRLYVPPEERVAVEACLHRICRMAEGYLKDIATVQVRAGNVTIENQFYTFENAYRFFRKKAKRAYRSRAPKAKILARDKDGNPMGWSRDPFKPQREGGYYTTAMLDAYFSRLEHLLVLVLPFLGFNGSGGELLVFVGLDWGEKWRKIFGSNKSDATKIFESLHRVKESIRNPSSHGGFAKKGESFYFHVDDIGALPALLSGRGKTEIAVVHVAEQTYEEVCQALDEADDFLSQSIIHFGFEFVRSGLDVVFSPDMVAEYQKACKSEDDFQRFVDYQGHLWEMHTNMDY